MELNLASILSVPCRPGTPAYKIQVKTSSRTCIYMLSCVIWLRTSPLCWDDLQHCHVSYSSGPRLTAEVGSGTAMCPVAPDLTSRLMQAPSLLCVLWLRTSPPNQGGLRRCHVSYDSGPHLPARASSGAVICPMAPGLDSRLRWALKLPCVLWLWTSPLGWGELWCCQVSYDSGPCLLVEVRSSAVTYLTAPCAPQT
jgi:hypothetical protein